MPRNNKPDVFRLIFIFVGGLILLFIIAPIAGIFLNTSAGDFLKTGLDKEVRSSIWLTLWTSMAGTLLLSIAAIPFSYLMARKDFPFKSIILAIIDIPVIIPHSAAGIAILGVLAPNSFIGKFAAKLGISFIGNPIGIMIAMAFVSIPFLINSAKNGFEAVPERLEKAALSLGASRSRVFFSISLPLAYRSIITGLVMMWARGLSEFGAVIIVAYNPMITPVLIYQRFTAFGLKYARPVAAVFILVVLVIFMILRFISREKRNA
nr:ABC transporter permease [Spirochaetota bacterium]